MVRGGRYISFLILSAVLASSPVTARSARALDCWKLTRPNGESSITHPSMGYLSEVHGLSASAAHTIEDIPKYLSDSLGPEAMQAVKEKRGFLIIEGDGPDATKILSDQGWVIEHEVAKPVGFHRVYRVSKDGEIRYAITRVNGEDRVIHMQTFLRLANVDPHLVQTIRNYRNWLPEYVSAFKQTGHKPDLVVYGLTPHVEGTFINTNDLLDRPYNYLRRSEPSLDDSDIALRPFKVVHLEDGRKVWLIYPLYGDLAREIVQAAYDAGARKILFLGTAGGVDPALKVGDWVSPISSSTGKSKVSKSARYVRVSTPNIETEAWLAEQNRNRTGMIEVEAGYVMEIAKKHPDLDVKIDMILSDVLQGPNKLDLHQIPRISQIPNLHSGIESILEESLGSFRLRQVEDVYMSTNADEQLFKVSNAAAGPELLKTAKKLNMQRLGSGKYQKTEVFSAQFGNLYFSADIENLPPKWIGFKAKLIGNPLHYHVPGERYLVEKVLYVANHDPKELRRIIELAYERGAGEVRFVDGPRGYEVTVSFAVPADVAPFVNAVQAGDTFTNGLRSKDLETRVRASRNLILAKNPYRAQFRLNKAKLLTKLPEYHPLFPIIQKVMEQLNDPVAMADFVESVLRRTAAHSKGVPSVEEYKGTLAAILKEANSYPIVSAPRMFLSSKAFNKVLSQGRPFLDETFLGRTHGGWTHVFQMAYLSKLFTQELGPNGTELFLKKMSELPDTELWGFVFDSLNDIPNHFSNPEILNQVVWRTFGMN